MMNKIKKTSLLLGIAGLAMIYQNCALVKNTGTTSANADSASSLSTTLEQKAMGVLAAKCMSCHNAKNPQGYLDVTSINSMLYYRQVVPGEPQLSNVFYEVTQGLMPPDQNTALSQAEIAILSDWIANGFKDGTPTVTAPSGPAITPTYSSIKSQVLVVSCNGCHSGTNAKGGVSLDSYANVMKVVTAGNSATSTLYKSIIGDGATLMPPGGGLSAKQKTAIKDWIDSGALLN